MGGWTFEVERRRVKTKTCTVTAYSQDQAIEIAKRANAWDEDGTAHTEYVAREIYYD